MKVRSITFFADVEAEIDDAQLSAYAMFVQQAKGAFQEAGIDVQTTRLATRASAAILNTSWESRLPEWCSRFEAAACAQGFEYLSVGPMAGRALKQVPDVLRATHAVFATSQIIDPVSGRIDGGCIRLSASVIREAAGIEDGFGNLRFAALANVRPWTPFFPGSFGVPGQTAFALAIESADMAVRACQGAPNAAVAHDRLVADIEDTCGRLEAVARQVARAGRIPFRGIDLSLAPFPNDECSIGGALELLSGQPLGGAGTLAAAATLTDAIDRAKFEHTGYCGLMMPVLEDSVLARRAAQGRLNIGELLQWSAVCGTGLDTVPVPGDTSEKAISRLLYDVAALSARLAKPLTARLMPLPGKSAGDPVDFDFAYFAPGGVLAVEDSGETGLFENTEMLGLSARLPRAIG